MESVGTTRLAQYGPMTTPARISPMTAGNLSRSNISPKSLAQTKIKKSWKRKASALCIDVPACWTDKNLNSYEMPETREIQSRCWIFRAVTERPALDFSHGYPAFCHLINSHLRQSKK